MVQIISILVAVLFVIQVANYTSKNKLQDQQALLWLILAFSGLVLALSLPLFDRLAGWMGISYMPSLIFMFGFLIILTVLVFQTTTITKQQTQIKKLSQELAYTSKRLEDLREELTQKGR